VNPTTLQSPAGGVSVQGPTLARRMTGSHSELGQVGLPTKRRANWLGERKIGAGPLRVRVRKKWPFQKSGHFLWEEAG
jgi:hypothetical protein